jgi:outer membrane lipoprotein LolB
MRKPRSRLLFAITLPLLLAACATRPPASVDVAATAAHAQRHQRLSAMDHWSLSGKISIDDGQEGGSGRLNWTVEGAHSRLEFRGALGRGAWQLEISPNLAVLEKADGRVVQAANLRDLVEFEVGWHVPVDALRWWILGLAAPGAHQGLTFDAAGRPLTLSQDDWQVDFSRYQSFGDVDLPGRLDARNGERRVKLAIVSWNPAFPARADG